MEVSRIMAPKNLSFYLALIYAFAAWTLTSIMMLVHGMEKAHLSFSSQFDLELLTVNLQSPPRTLRSGQETTVSLGWKVVNAAFNQGYSDFVNICHKNATSSSSKCMEKAYIMSKNQTHPYAKKWPWWFQNMLRDGPKPETGLHGGWHQLQYEAPSLRQCVLEKVGTKHWQIMYEEHHGCPKPNGTETLASTCYNKHPRLPESERFVFLRDPLARFLSGFLDKCGPKRSDSAHCEPRSVMVQEDTKLVKDYQQDLRNLFEIYVDIVPLKWNLHFFPQALYCGGLYNQIEDYDFVGIMGESFKSDVDHLVSQYPQLQDAAKRAFPKLVSTLNSDAPKEKGTPSLSDGVETKAASLAESIYTPHSLRRVLEYSSIDYTMLNLPIPGWAEQMLREASD